MSDAKVVNFGERLRTKTARSQLRRMLARTIREMRETGATPQEISSILAECAEEVSREKPFS